MSGFKQNALSGI